MNKYITELIAVSSQSEAKALKEFQEVKRQTDRQKLSFQEKIKILKLLNYKMK